MSSRLRAALLLGAVLLTFVHSLPRSTGWVGSASDVVMSDPAVYRRILRRLHAREEYYDVVGEELRQHGYATLEVFNWRTPLLWSGLAPLPVVARRNLLIGLALLTCVAATATALRRSVVAAVVTAVAALGVGLVMSAPGSIAMGEAWAGGLVGLSVCAYARGRIRTGCGLALVAIFIRELTAPYTLICAALAVRQRRWGELAAWVAGGVAYGFYYGAHLMQIWAHRLPSDLPGEGSWVAWGGLTFLLSTVEWNGLLLIAPWSAVAGALALIVGGVLNGRAPMHVRLTAGTYAMLFLVVGQSFDWYWGLMTWPVWMLACGYGADALVSAASQVLGVRDPVALDGTSRGRRVRGQ